MEACVKLTVIHFHKSHVSHKLIELTEFLQGHIRGLQAMHSGGPSSTIPPNLFGGAGGFVYFITLYNLYWYR